MNWTSTLQQLVEMQEAFRIQKVYDEDEENVCEDEDNISEEVTLEQIGKNNDDEKYRNAE